MSQNERLVDLVHAVEMVWTNGRPAKAEPGVISDALADAKRAAANGFPRRCIAHLISVFGLMLASQWEPE